MIYRRVKGSWIEEQIIMGTSDTSMRFGSAIAIEDNTLVIGLPPTGTHWLHGHPLVQVHEYDEERGVWGLTDEIAPPYEPREWLSFFGRSVSIDSGLIAIGDNANDFTWADAIGHDHEPRPLPPSDFMGEVGASVYRQHPISEEWVMLKRLIADDPQYYDEFGVSVDVSGDCVAVGAYLREDMAGENEGGAYVFCDIPQIVPIDTSTVDVDFICCKVPMDPIGSFPYLIKLTSSKSEKSVPVLIRVNIEYPNGKIRTIDKSEYQLALDGEPLTIEGRAQLGSKAEPGEYKLSVKVIKSSGASQTQHQYFKVH